MPKDTQVVHSRTEISTWLSAADFGAFIPHHHKHSLLPGNAFFPPKTDLVTAFRLSVSNMKLKESDKCQDASEEEM